MPLHLGLGWVLQPNWFGLQGPEGCIRWRTQLCVWGSHRPSMPQGMGLWLALALFMAVRESVAAIASSGRIARFCIVGLMIGFEGWLRSISPYWLPIAADRFFRRRNFVRLYRDAKAETLSVDFLSSSGRHLRTWPHRGECGSNRGGMVDDGFKL
jgi:hypothetical protein